MRKKLLLTTGLALALAVSSAWGQELGKKRAPLTGGAIVVHSAYRASTITGMAVRNSSDENLGKIEDLVIDLNSGEVRYAALSFGGFLGVGDKLFAVPMRSLRLVVADKDRHFVLNVDKKRLEKAPGFNKDAWPDFANPNWSVDVDKFYEADARDTKVKTIKTVAKTNGTRHDGIVVNIKDNRLTMTDKDGETPHSHDIDAKVAIMLDGKPAQLNDLKSGYAVTVTTGANAVVMAIDARSRRAER